jgi:ribosomal protein S18 acetylase RimI-like enzyme
MELKLFNETDFDILYGFMAPIWKDTYKDVIPDEQIDFLLNKYFSADGIAYFRSVEYTYYKLLDNGICGIVVICEKDGCTYLDKLYLSPESRGKGYARFVFSELLKLGRDITLNVNQGNARAIACYKKNGFTVAAEERIPLENGMVNIDYKMRLAKDSVAYQEA